MKKDKDRLLFVNPFYTDSIFVYIGKEELVYGSSNTILLKGVFLYNTQNLQIDDFRSDSMIFTANYTIVTEVLNPLIIEQYYEKLKEIKKEI